MSYDMTDFEQDVIEQSKTVPVLVDFWAAWCGPCRVLGPVLERLAEQHSGEWRLVKVDTEKYPELSTRYGVRSIPNVKLFVDGKVADEFTGAQPDYAIEQWLKRSLPEKHAATIQRAEQLIEEQKTEEAQALLEYIVADSPQSEHARVLLAHMLVFSAPVRAAELVREVLADSPWFHKAEAIRTFAHLAETAGHPETLADHPIKERYLNAVRALEQLDFDTALEGFIEVLREHRYYDDDGSRKACIAIFKYLGEDHETTCKYRRTFDSALY